jgi:thiol:disulfide interchange protein DsbD
MRILLLLSLLWLAASPARALESAPLASPGVVASLVTDSDTAAPGQPLHVGLRLRMAPGWHTYWRNPGDAGQAPTLELTLPPGTKAGPIAWPAPDVQREEDLTTYGYTGDLLLTREVTPQAGPLAVTADATWLMCKQVCVPEQASFHLTLPAGPLHPSAQASLFAASDAAQPRVGAATARLAPDGTLSVRDSALSAYDVRGAVFVPAEPGRLDASQAQSFTAGAGVVTLRLALRPALAPAPLPGVLLLRDAAGGIRALAITAEPEAAAPAGPPLAEVLAGAFLAGLILNLMPCVFPVLAMKALAVVRLSGAARGQVRAHALSYTLGVLAAFAALAGLMLGLRAAGGAAGWGFQFQSPAFVAGLAWLMFGVGLSLSGVFSLGGSLTGAGQSLAGRGGHIGSFFTGLLAVVVATPCTAPFMGAALAAALAAAVPVTIGVFLTMGLGLAAPYLLLAVLPHLGVVLPRPGRWMEILKQGLAFPMYGAAAWLVWVLSEEAGPAGVLAGATGLVMLGFAAWALGLAQRADQPGPHAGGGRRIAHAAALAACLAALAVLSGIATLPATPTRIAQEGAAEPFSAARLAALRAQGRPVFVNMTAAWCLTCLLNERVALSPPDVRRAFAARGIVYMRGDWTRQDPAITAFLRGHARDGVPLYVFYPAGGGAAQVLPQILTEHAVLARIAAAGA